MRFKLLTVLVALSMVASEPISGCACEPFTPEKQFTHKAEVAFQLVQGEVDRVRLWVERSHNVPDDLSIFNGNSLMKLPAPTAINNRFLLSFGSACSGSSDRENMSIAVNELLRVDIDQDCKADFLLQVARTQETRGKAFSSKKNSVLVRVYSSMAEADISSLKTEPIFLNSPFNLTAKDLRPLDVLQEQERLQPLAALKAELTL